MRLKTPLLCFLMVFVACAERPPSHGLPANKLEAVYAALLEGGGKMRPLQSDSMRQVHSDSIFRAFGTTEEAFRLSLDAYKANPELWKQFFEGVTKKLEERQKPQQKKGEPQVVRTTPE